MEKQELELKWKPEMEMEKEMMEMEKQMMEMQPPIRVVGLARYVLLGFMPTLASQSPPTSSFNCKLHSGCDYLYTAL